MMCKTTLLENTEKGGLNYNITSGSYVKPYVCPTCGGRGTVSCGFYNWLAAATTDAAPEMCRSCSGTGIVWRQ